MALLRGIARTAEKLCIARIKNSHRQSFCTSTQSNAEEQKVEASVLKMTQMYQDVLKKEQPDISFRDMQREERYRRYFRSGFKLKLFCRFQN